MACNRSEDSAEDFACLRRVHLGHQDRKLVATQAGREITLAETAADDLCQLDQYAVADLVAQTVVDVLEVVDVDQCHGIGGARPPG